MREAALAGLGWFVVGWMPGFAVVTALWPAASTARRVAIAPMISLGLLMLVAESYDRASVAVRPARRSS